MKIVFSDTTKQELNDRRDDLRDYLKVKEAEFEIINEQIEEQRELIQALQIIVANVNKEAT